MFPMNSSFSLVCVLMEENVIVFSHETSNLEVHTVELMKAGMKLFLIKFGVES